jgi:hypothetical protein
MCRPFHFKKNNPRLLCAVQRTKPVGCLRLFGSHFFGPKASKSTHFPYIVGTLPRGMFPGKGLGGLSNCNQKVSGNGTNICVCRVLA